MLIVLNTQITSELIKRRAAAKSNYQRQGDERPPNHAGQTKSENMTIGASSRTTERMWNHAQPFKLTAHAGSGSALHLHRLPAGSSVKLNKLDLWPTSDLDHSDTGSLKHVPGKAPWKYIVYLTRTARCGISTVRLVQHLTRTAGCDSSPIRLGTVSHQYSLVWYLTRTAWYGISPVRLGTVPHPYVWYGISPV